MLSQVSVPALVQALVVTTARVTMRALHHPEITSCLVRCCLTALENFTAEQRVVLPSAGLSFTARPSPAVYFEIVCSITQRKIGRRDVLQPVPRLTEPTKERLAEYLP
jgi:hypothetical protein